MTPWDAWKLWRLYKQKGEPMLTKLLANPTFRGWVTKFGFLSWAAVGALQLGMEYQGQTPPALLDTGFPAMANFLIGVVGFGLARKFQVMIELLKSAGVKITPEQEAALTDAATKTPTPGGSTN